MKKLVSLLLAACLMASLATVPAFAEEDPFAQPVELVWYAIGTGPADGEMVMAEFNKVLSEKYNTTIKLNYTGWDDWENKYNLLLTSGEKIDLVYVNATLYNRYAPVGAFKDLTELFPTLMPKTYAFFDEDSLGQMSVDGKIYAVPLSMHGYIPYGIFYRKDLADKYGCEPITDIATFESYMDAIVANEPGITPYNGNPSDAFLYMFRANYGFETIAGSTSSIIVMGDIDDTGSVIAYPFTDEYVEWSKKIKEWADRGYWSSNCLSATLGTWDNIQVGTSAISVENPEGVASLVTTISKLNPDFAFDYWCFTSLTGYSVPNPVLQDGFAVPQSSQNTERTLRILEAIKTDPELYDLYMYGIEGYHYDLTEDGQLVTPSASQDPSVVTGYDPAGAGWGMRVEDLVRTNVTQWSGLEPLMDEIRSISVPNRYGAISLDYADVQAELAAVNQVVQQYGTPINVGLVDDVDAAIAEYRQKLTDAGIDKLVAYVQETVTAACGE